MLTQEPPNAPEWLAPKYFTYQIFKCNLNGMGRLQDEIKQRKPFQSPAHEAVIALLRTADLVRRQITALIEPHGITMQQFNVLRILRGGGADGVPTLDVADRMIEQAPGVTRLL